ncbi:MAG: hypothetical protein CMJ18_01040 [Phycisphaeraceae bacterium]|nr:hypothetical protein [Phycisphaeraceae bacterium]
MAVLIAGTLTGCCMDLGRSRLSSRRYRLYGADLELASGGRVLLWPSDDTGHHWRYAVERPNEAGVTGEDLQAVSLRPGADDVPFVARDLSGATVLLPPSASGEVRAGGRRMLRGLERAHPGLSTHLVVCDRDPSRSRSVEDLARLLRPRDKPPSGLGIDEWMALVAILSGPTLTVAPRSDDSSMFFVVETVYAVPDGMLRERSGYVPTVKSRNHDAICAAAAVGSERPVRIALLVPHDATDAHQAALRRLFFALAEAPNGPSVVWHPTRFGLARFRDGDAITELFRELLGEGLGNDRR